MIFDFYLQCGILEALDGWIVVGGRVRGFDVASDWIWVLQEETWCWSKTMGFHR